MDHPLTIAEIKSQFANEWVLIDDPTTDERLEVLSGRVVLHCNDREEFDRRSLEFKAKRFAIMFMGRPPADMEFALTPFILPVGKE